MIENSQLLEYVGETWTEKLKNEISKEYFELKEKQFTKVENIVSPMAIVRVTDPNETEIKSIGMSCVNDLLSDNWGKFIAGFFTGTTLAYTMTNTSNIIRNYTPYGLGSVFNVTDHGVVGTLMYIGKGTTPATRQDHFLDSPFVTAPEINAFDTGFGGWNSGLGQVTVNGLLTPTGGAGNISETLLVGQWVSNDTTRNNISLSRDNISPVVSFIIGQAVNLEYILQVS